jgi:hypothetical protein
MKSINYCFKYLNKKEYICSLTNNLFDCSICKIYKNLDLNIFYSDNPQSAINEAYEFVKGV